ncbi:Crp/Fnr family transcriptional regulator [Catenovulum sediminis]|uniref:Crp/Fnr family transcriptional regulator n=1 Tax=Catenovulum sediminis TaxID=1740262 RepID=A0ABV1RJ67_9ALTE
MDFNDLFKQSGIRVERQKGEHVFIQGDFDNSLYFIQSGLLMAYYTSKAGKESIKSFLLPNNIIASLAAIHCKNACSFSLICLDNSVLQKISFDQVSRYAKQDLQLSNCLVASLLDLAMKKERREYEFLCLSAEERYAEIKNTNPILLETVSQTKLASYLGITPVALSRIKKRNKTASRIIPTKA